MFAKLDDADLVVAVRGGRPEALRELYERHAPWIMARLRRRTEDEGAIDEAVQDTFLAVWRQVDGFDPARGSVGAWMWGIAIRRLIDRTRRRSTARTYGPPVADDEPIEESAEETALRVELGDVGDALDRLSPELQQVLRVRVLDGLSTKEAADLLQIPVGTVKTRMMRARRELREVMT
jgi:RNA polymerase sigma-70 factor (ECF subfamily)